MSILAFNRQIRILLVLGLLTVFSKVHAQDKIQLLLPLGISQNIEAQRSAFLRIETLMYAMSDTELATELQRLDDYPLTPYLVAEVLVQRMSMNRIPQIREFLSEFSNTPLERRVRRPLLAYLLKQKRYDLFLEFYRSGYSTEIQCAYFRHYPGDKGSDEYTQGVATLWNVGKSQPRVCDPVFKEWMDNGGLSEDLVLQRIEKAANVGSQRLITYLTKLLSDDKKYLARLWRDARKNPSRTVDLDRFKGKYPLIEADIFTSAVKRLIWQDPDLALERYLTGKPKLVLNNKHHEDITSTFAIALALDHDPRAELWLMQVLDLKPDEATLHWHLAFLIRQQQWQKIKLLIEKVPPQLSNSLQFQYWYARAHEQIGQEEAAKDIYLGLSKRRHYYGFLASARLNVQPSLAHRPLETDESDINQILASSFARRAFELRAIGRDYRARLEWRYLQRDLSDRALLASAKVSSAWHWHDQTIHTLGSLEEFDDVELRFPVAYPELLVKEAQKNNLQPAWSLAIARRESAFMADAVSTANARGLMQILPSTARYIEKRRISSRDLLKPDVSARLGNKYLRYLLDKLGNNNLLATASYNAGWRKVVEWLPKEQAIDADVWIELIPYKETRSYVKAVLAYQQIYQTKLIEPLDNEVFVNLANSQVNPKS
ncbi:MAG: transglycosylase SLT domain-containing protein [Pseudomonadota bacterium]